MEQLIVINYDNTSAINISKNLAMHSRTKHTSIKYHFVSEQVQVKEAKLEYIPIKEKLIDIFTNPLQKDMFEYIREWLGVLPLSCLK